MRRAVTLRSFVLMSLLGVALAAEGDGKAPEKTMKATMVHYSGKVQGVGFRATAAMIARDYPVTGWVKNLDDGRVQLLVEGADDAVEKFLKAIRERWKKDIEMEQTEERKPGGQYKSFAIAR